MRDARSSYFTYSKHEAFPADKNPSRIQITTFTLLITFALQETEVVDIARISYIEVYTEVSFHVVRHR